jgi:hypothetical protein
MLLSTLEGNAQRLEEDVTRVNFPWPHYSLSAVWNAQVIWLGETVETVLNSLL